MMPTFADTSFTNPITAPNNLPATATGAETFVGLILQFLTIVGGLWFIFWIIIAGFNWITTEGKPDKLEKARTQVIHAIVGLVVLISAYALTALIGAILNVDFFDLSPFFI